MYYLQGEGKKQITISDAVIVPRKITVDCITGQVSVSLEGHENKSENAEEIVIDDNNPYMKETVRLELPNLANSISQTVVNTLIGKDYSEYEKKTNPILTVQMIEAAEKENEVKDGTISL